MDGEGGTGTLEESHKVGSVALKLRGNEVGESLFKVGKIGD